jgi:VIT1/CCC1 family predicted Fe2+/Mn2+ transporter
MELRSVRCMASFGNSVAPSTKANDPRVARGHVNEPHSGGLAARLNWLRAGVLGANDGIVSTAGLVVGVAAATTARSPIITAGIAGLAAGAVAMALGEYVSVSSQRDTERALLAKERTELAEEPERELAELAGIYQAKGLTPATADLVARELTAHDAFAAHVHAELGIDPGELTSPWHAAAASAVSFTLGALLPVLAILLPAAVRIPVTFLVVLLALAMTGTISARLGGAPRNRAVARVVLGGALAMLVTFGIGQLVGAVGI